MERGPSMGGRSLKFAASAPDTSPEPHGRITPVPDQTADTLWEFMC